MTKTLSEEQAKRIRELLRRGSKEGLYRAQICGMLDPNACLPALKRTNHTILYEAIHTGNWKAATWLVEMGADPNIKYMDQYSLIAMAFQKLTPAQDDVYRFIVACMKDKVACDASVDYYKPWQYAVLQGNVVLAEQLYMQYATKKGAPPDIDEAIEKFGQYQGCSMLSVLVLDGPEKREPIRYLLEKGADPFARKGKFASALELAVTQEEEHPGLVAFLNATVSDIAAQKATHAAAPMAVRKFKLKL